MRIAHLALTTLLALPAQASPVPIDLSDNSMEFRLSVRGQEINFSVPQAFSASGSLDPDAFTFTLDTWSLLPPTAPITWQSSPYTATVTYDPPGFEETVVTIYEDITTQARFDWGGGYSLEGVGALPVLLHLDPITLRAVYVATLSQRLLGTLSVSLPWLQTPAVLSVIGSPILALECYAGSTCDAQLGLGLYQEDVIFGGIYATDWWPVLEVFNPPYTSVSPSNNTAHVIQTDIHWRVGSATYGVPEPKPGLLLLAALAIALLLSRLL